MNPGANVDYYYQQKEKRGSKNVTLKDRSCPEYLHRTFCGFVTFIHLLYGGFHCCMFLKMTPKFRSHNRAEHFWMWAEMCSERDSPLKRLYRRTHAKLTRLPGFRQLVWAAGCELSLALVHARGPAWPGETSETILRVAPPRKTRPPDRTRVNWPVDASASGSAQVGSGRRHRWAARVQVGREPARQKAGEGYPSHYTSLMWVSPKTLG